MANPKQDKLNTKKVTSRYSIVKFLETEDKKETVIRMMANLQYEAMLPTKQWNDVFKMLEEPSA